MSRLLRVQVLYFKCGCAARVVIIHFSYMHTICQHKRLSLAHEEPLQQNYVPDRISEVPDQACSNSFTHQTGPW